MQDINHYFLSFLHANNPNEHQNSSDEKLIQLIDAMKDIHRYRFGKWLALHYPEQRDLIHNILNEYAKIDISSDNNLLFAQAVLWNKTISIISHQNERIELSKENNIVVYLNNAKNKLWIISLEDKDFEKYQILLISKSPPSINSLQGKTLNEIYQSKFTSMSIPSTAKAYTGNTANKIINSFSNYIFTKTPITKKELSKVSPPIN